MPFTDKEVQDKWKAHLEWMKFVKQYTYEISELNRKCRSCYNIAVKLKDEHSKMVKANRDERNASN